MDKIKIQQQQLNKSLALPFYSPILTNIYLIFYSEERSSLIVCKGDAMQCERMYIETYTKENENSP